MSSGTFVRSIAIMLLSLGLVLGGGPPLIVHAASLTVTTTDDELNADGDCSLREAIRAANLDVAVDACTAGHHADTIVVPASVYTLTLLGTDEDAAATGDLDITNNVTIKGAGAGKTIIDGNWSDRVFQIIAGNVTISAVTLRNGNVLDTGNGGGVLNASGSLKLVKTTVRTYAPTRIERLGSARGTLPIR